MLFYVLVLSFVMGNEKKKSSDYGELWGSRLNEEGTYVVGRRELFQSSTYTHL